MQFSFGHQKCTHWFVCRTLPAGNFVAYYLLVSLQILFRMLKVILVVVAEKTTDSSQLTSNLKQPQHHKRFRLHHHQSRWSPALQAPQMKFKSRMRQNNFKLQEIPLHHPYQLQNRHHHPRSRLQNQLRNQLQNRLRNLLHPHQLISQFIS